MTHMALWLVMACSSGTVALDPETVAALAEAIEEAPDKADEVLAAKGVDRAAFDAALYDIAADPELTKRYLAARQ